MGVIEQVSRTGTYVSMIFDKRYIESRHFHLFCAFGLFLEINFTKANILPVLSPKIIYFLMF